MNIEICLNNTVENTVDKSYIDHKVQLAILKEQHLKQDNILEEAVGLFDEVRKDLEIFYAKYNTFSLHNLTNEILDFLSKIEDIKSYINTEQLQQIFLNFKEIFLMKNFSPTSIKEMISFYLSFHSIRLKLIEFMSVLEKNNFLHLKEKVNEFLNFLEDLHNINQRNIQCNERPILYFPFFLSSDFKKERLELFIRPDLSEKKELQNANFAFCINLDTVYLGRLRVFLNLVSNKIFCKIFVERDDSFRIIDKQKDVLKERLENFNFLITHISCELLKKIKDSFYFNQDLELEV